MIYTECVWITQVIGSCLIYYRSGFYYWVIQIPTILECFTWRRGQRFPSIHWGARCMWDSTVSISNDPTSTIPQIHRFPVHTGWRANLSSESGYWWWFPSLTNCVVGQRYQLSSFRLKGPNENQNLQLWELRVFISFAGFSYFLVYFLYTAVVVIFYVEVCNNKWPLNKFNSLLSVSLLMCNTGS